MQSQQMAVHLRPGRAMMIEDDPDVVACAEVAAGQVQLQVVPDGETALAALDGTDLPDVVLLDLELPGLHGLEVLERLRSRPQTRHIPIVVFTGTQGDPAQGYARGANAWVEKPRDAEALELAIQQIFQFWLRHNARAH